MKKTLLSFIFITISLIGYSQDSKIKDFNDLDIAKNLIGKYGNQVESILDKYEIEYWVTENSNDKKTIYISYNESIRAWDLEIGSLYRESYGDKQKVADNIVTIVFVRYKHNSLHDLRDFNSYEVINEIDLVETEKQQGIHSSHLKLTKR